MNEVVYSPLDVSQAQKAQWIRIADVTLIGPLMIAGGMALTRRSPFFGILLGAFGIGTIVFNGYNWWQVQQALQQQAPQVPEDVIDVG